MGKGDGQCGLGWCVVGWQEGGGGGGGGSLARKN